jgi:hypothetical protein
MPVPLPRTPPPAVIPDNPSTRYTPERLFKWGVQRADAFCLANGIRRMETKLYIKEEWLFSHVCAYWRDWTCHICLPHCGRPARGENDRRAWSWPGATTDRTPYGVVCHELGHHCDVLASTERGPYYGEYSQSVFTRAKEKAISGYEPNNPAEWFAEMFRLFVTNHALLLRIRPRTWEILMERWTPVSDHDWRVALGPDCPARIIKAQEKK